MRLSAFQDPQAGNNSQGARGFSLSDAIAQSFPGFVGDVAPREHDPSPWRRGNQRALRRHMMIRCPSEAGACVKRLLDLTEKKMKKHKFNKKCVWD